MIYKLTTSATYLPYLFLREKKIELNFSMSFVSGIVCLESTNAVKTLI